MTNIISTTDIQNYSTIRNYPNKKLWINAAILVEAATEGDLATVEQRMNQSIQITDYAKALIGAAREGHLDVLEPLVAGCGAVMAEKLIKRAAAKRANKDLNLSRIYQDLIDAAASNGHFTVVKYLLKQRANVPFIKAYALKNKHKDNDALEKAAANGHLNVVKHLMEAEDAWVQFIAIHDQVLKNAIRYGHLEVIKYLATYVDDIEGYSDPDGYETDPWYCGYTNFLLPAVSHGHLEIVKFFGERGASVDFDNGNSLIAAIKHGYLEIAKYLLEWGCDPNCQSGTALIDAVISGSLPMVKCIVEHRANVNVADESPLKIAMATNNLEIVTYLLEHGAGKFVDNAQLKQYLTKRRGNIKQGWWQKALNYAYSLVT